MNDERAAQRLALAVTPPSVELPEQVSERSLVVMEFPSLPEPVFKPPFMFTVGKGNELALTRSEVSNKWSGGNKGTSVGGDGRREVPILKRMGWS